MPTTIENCFHKFITKKRLSGLTDKSILSYRQHIGIFINYVGSDLAIDILNEDSVYSYIEHLLERKISKGTLSSYVRDAKIFLVWLEKEYHLTNIKATEIKVPKSPKTFPRIYSSDDCRLIFSLIKTESDWMTFRNKSMIALMYDSGMRQSEVCNIKTSDIDFVQNTIRVNGKGHKQRLVPLGDLSKEYLNEYFLLCPFQSDSVFVDRHGNTITNNALKLLIRKIGQRLPFEFSCHKLRHNFATNYCIDQYERYGRVDIYSLRSLMGHENIETTERYLHYAMDLMAAKTYDSHLDKIMKTG